MFVCMSGNCTEKTGFYFPGVRGWDTLTVSGIRVGILGTTIVREYPAYVHCADADSATHALVDTLSRASADLIVALTHRGIAEDTRTLSREPRIQAILGGHDHNGKRSEVDGRLVIKALSNSRTTVLVTFTRRDNRWQRSDTSFSVGPSMREDARTAAVVAIWNDSLRRRIGPDRVIGTSPNMIDGTDSTQHRGESVFGDLIADALRTGTNSDVGLINSGALRFDDFIAPGPITSHMIESVFLFADETRAVTFSMTGARLREVLEHGVATSSVGQGAFLQVSGVNYTYDTGKADGQRIVGAVRRDDGRAYLDADVVRVTMVTYPACRGGDGYKFPEAANACQALEADAASAPRTADLVIKHIESSGGQIALPTVGRVLRVSR
ncbi:MAG: 5'-nucleotidase C-terminal domain-containing protein [Gemmatimonadota bacterium]|nr:5'-nucleotidase C-terminal domain-containing protein [Gemmatimonadota bacterium]